MGSIKVRDLAADLGVSYKEILQVLRDLDIQVKSQVSTLEEDEAKLVRQRLAQGVTVTEVIKEVQPGVVRRRRKTVQAADETPEHAEEAMAASAEHDVSAAEEKAEEPAPAVSAPAEEPVSEPVQVEEKAEAAPAPERRKVEAKPVSARIVSRPDDEPAAPAPA